MRPARLPHSLSLYRPIATDDIKPSVTPADRGEKRVSRYFTSADRGKTQKRVKINDIPPRCPAVFTPIRQGSSLIFGTPRCSTFHGTALPAENKRISSSANKEKINSVFLLPPRRLTRKTAQLRPLPLSQAKYQPNQKNRQIFCRLF